MDLDQQADDFLIRKILIDRDDNALVELMERHSGVFIDTVKKYAPFNISPYDRDILIQEKPSIFFDAIMSYNKERCKFVTWLANRTKYYLLSKRSNEKKKPLICEFEESYIGETNLTPDSYLEEKTRTEEILKLVEDHFGSEAKNIFSQKYFGGNGGSGKTFLEIAEEVGVTPQAVQAKHLKIIKFLKNKLK